MNGSDPSPGDRWLRRCWHGALGAFLFALLGLIAATVLHASLWIGTGVGALVGWWIGFLLGPDALELVMTHWPLDGA